MKSKESHGKEGINIKRKKGVSNVKRILFLFNYPLDGKSYGILIENIILIYNRILLCMN